jgi:hypothetical protein
VPRAQRRNPALPLPPADPGPSEEAPWLVPFIIVAVVLGLLAILIISIFG